MRPVIACFMKGTDLTLDTSRWKPSPKHHVFRNDDAQETGEDCDTDNIESVGWHRITKHE